MSNGRDRRRQLNQQERLFVYERAGGQCQNCGGDLPSNYHNAHLAAWSRGGATSVDNIRAWCPDCNLGLGAQDSELAEGVTLRQWQQQALPVILRQLYQNGVATPPRRPRSRQDPVCWRGLSTPLRAAVREPLGGGRPQPRDR